MQSYNGMFLRHFNIDLLCTKHVFFSTVWNNFFFIVTNTDMSDFHNLVGTSTKFHVIYLSQLGLLSIAGVIKFAM